MGTDAGIRFKATQETVDAMNEKLDDLDFVVNDSGLGVSCTPHIYKYSFSEAYVINGQTHWSHQNGVVLLREMKRWIKGNKFDIQIVDTWEI